MERKQTLHLVKSEDLNLHGTLYAARIASWFVEAGFAAAAVEHGIPKEIAFVSTHNMAISKPIEHGDIVSFNGQIVRVGETSITVFVDAVSETTGAVAVEGFTTFVVVDNATGKKKQHNIELDDTTDLKELEKRELANKLFSK